MICVICKQDEVRLGKATVVFEREGTTVVISACCRFCAVSS
jgi:hypothetical protein